jgi:hypothetical protein
MVLLLSSLVQGQTTKPNSIPDVWSWADAGNVGIDQMVWAMGPKWPGTMNPDQVADQLLSRPAGNRVILLLHAAEGRPQDPAEFIAFGMDDFEQRKFYANSFAAIAAKVRPDGIVLDDEWGYSNWELFAQQDDRQAIAVASNLYTNAFVRAVMPKDVASLTPQSFRAAGWWSAGYPSVVTWNTWTEQLKYNQLDRLVFAQARAAWPKMLDYGNWTDARGKFPYYDANGWPIANIAGVSRSCPVMYLNVGNAVASYHGYTKHPLWNRLIQTINAARSCAAAGPTWCWVSYPSWSGDYVRQYPVDTVRAVWAEQIRHLSRYGVKYLYWNPAGNDKLADDDSFAAKVFTENPTRRIRSADMVEIKMDADEIRSGDTVTRYSDLRPILEK